MSTIVTKHQTCHCGHDVDTHYLDRECQPAERASCLGRGCACHKYVNEHDASPKKLLSRPRHARWCQCFNCKAFDAQEKTSAAEETGPETDPYPSSRGFGSFGGWP